MRVLILVTHLLGVGHLTRAAAIARALVRAGHRATLVSGGTPAPLVETAGVAFVQLPPVRSAVGSFTALLDEAGRPIGPDRLASRRDRLLEAFAAVEPEVVVTELYPFGRRVLSGEFDALIAAVEAARPRPLLVSSVRDILVAPSKPDRREAAQALLRRAYDAVLVHGDETVLPLEASWPLADDLRARLLYTGYVDGSVEPHGNRQIAQDGSVLVSGGSSAASLPLYRAALEAAAIVPERRWRLLIGHGVTSEDYDALVRQAPPNAAVERARPDFRACLTEASVFVGQAGYNTVMDILAMRARAVLVPFEGGRETEQRLRAGELARRGHADLLPEVELDGPTLARRVQAAARLPRPVGGVEHDGADRAVALLLGLHAARRHEPGDRAVP